MFAEERCATHPKIPDLHLWERTGIVHAEDPNGMVLADEPKLGERTGIVHEEDPNGMVLADEPKPGALCMIAVRMILKFERCSPSPPDCESSSLR